MSPMKRASQTGTGRRAMRRTAPPTPTAATGMLSASTTTKSESTTNPIHHPPITTPTAKNTIARIGSPMSTSAPIARVSHGE